MTHYTLTSVLFPPHLTPPICLKMAKCVFCQHFLGVQWTKSPQSTGYPENFNTEKCCPISLMIFYNKLALCHYILGLQNSPWWSQSPSPSPSPVSYVLLESMLIFLWKFRLNCFWKEKYIFKWRYWCIDFWFFGKCCNFFTIFWQIELDFLRKKRYTNN